MKKTFIVPASKSIANRALILAALSEGKSELLGNLLAEDIQLMIRALQQLGVSITPSEKGIVIENDLSWRQDQTDLTIDVGPAGTCMRFLTTLVALRKGKTILKGTQRMHERPIKNLVMALQQLGIKIEYQGKEGFPPLVIYGNGEIEGGEVSIKGNISSQFISSLLLSSAAFQNGLIIKIEDELASQPYVEMTVRMLRQWGVNAEWHQESLHIPPTILKGMKYEVEGDASAATYWWAWGKIHDAAVEIENIPSDSLQGDVQFKKLLNNFETEGEWKVDMKDMPDAALTLMAIAPLRKGTTLIEGIGNLRIKESDRIEVMACELRKLGVNVETGQDWMRIHPLDLASYHGRKTIEIEPHDDHRVAMSFAILGMKLENLHITNPECVSKSYLDFWKQLKQL